MNDDLKNMIKYPDDDDNETSTEISEEAEETEEIEEASETMEDTAEEAEEVSEKSSLEEDETEADEEYFSSDNDDTGLGDENEDFDEEFEEDFFDEEDKPSKKKSIIRYTIVAAAIFLVMCVFSMIDTGVIGAYKRNFTANVTEILSNMGITITAKQPKTTTEPLNDLSGVSEDSVSEDGKTEQTKIKATPKPKEKEYKTDVDYSNIVPFDEASETEFAVYKKGIVCAKSNYICYITQNGDKKWEQQTQISNPVLSVGGKYIAVVGSGSTHLNLYKGKDLVFSIDVPNKIKTCSVSEKGDVALITEKEAYKGSVSVINKKGEEVFSWISGVNYITSVAMLKSRNVAISLVSTENTVKSYVMLFNIYDSDPINGTEIANSLIFNSDKHKNNAYICADNSIASVNKDGELNYCIRFDDMEITHTASDEKGRRAVSYTADNIPYINVYNRKGDLYASTETESVPDYIDIYKSTVLYNNGRDVLCGETDDIKTRYAAPMTVKNLIMINKNAYMIVYENSLEIVKL